MTPLNSVTNSKPKRMLPSLMEDLRQENVH